MEPLLEENEFGEVDEIIYPETSYCDKCKILMTWVAVWTFGFGFGFLTKTYTFNDEPCTGSM
jgi:hypothetical protein